MSLNYTTYQTALVTLMATTTGDPYFQDILPDIIDYAEQRIYRELDLLNTRFVDSTSACTPGTKSVSLPSSLMVLETLAVVTPAPDTPSAGTRNICLPVTHDFITTVYPSDGTAYQATPQYFAMLTQTTALLAPTPDAAYVVEIIGTERPAPLSATNTTTVLTTMLPDLFLAASMEWASLYQKNFAGAGTTSDDPAMGASWGAEYTKLMVYAKSEEFRKKFQSSSWTSLINSPVADRQRG